VKLVEFLTVPSSLEYSSQTRLYEGQEEGHLHKEEKRDHVIRYSILISYKHWHNHFCYTDASYCSAKRNILGKYYEKLFDFTFCVIARAESL